MQKRECKRDGTLPPGRTCRWSCGICAAHTRIPFCSHSASIFSGTDGIPGCMTCYFDFLCRACKSLFSVAKLCQVYYAAGERKRAHSNGNKSRENMQPTAGRASVTVTAINLLFTATHFRISLEAQCITGSCGIFDFNTITHCFNVRVCGTRKRCLKH